MPPSLGVLFRPKGMGLGEREGRCCLANHCTAFGDENHFYARSAEINSKKHSPLTVLDNCTRMFTHKTSYVYKNSGRNL